MPRPRLLHAAARLLTNDPLYTIGIVVTLALAVCAATTSTAIVRTTFFDPLPYRDAGRLVKLSTLVEGQRMGLSVHVVEDMSGGVRALRDVATQRPLAMTYLGEEFTDRVEALLASDNYFRTMGVEPLIGRTWDRGERHAVVVSWSFWQRALKGNTGAVGQRVRLDGTDYTIAGVLPPGFLSPYAPLTEVWLPEDVAALLADAARARRMLTAFGRLQTGATAEQLDAQLGALTAQLQRDFPAVHGGQSWVAEPLRASLVVGARPVVLAAGAAATLLLLIVCANAAGLSTARTVLRRQQLAIRLALGATAGRLVRDGIVESALLAGLGSLAGVWLAYAVVPVTAAYQKHFLAWLPPISLDAWTAAACAAAGFTVGTVAMLLPQVVVASSRSARTLENTRGATANPALRATGSGVVVVQVALALVLVAGAGLFIRTVHHLMSTPLGFTIDRLVTFQVMLPAARYAESQRQIQFEQAMLERLNGLAGVKSASAAVGAPVIGGMRAALAIAGRPAERARPEVAYFSIAPGFLPSLGIPLKAGRDLDERDDDSAPAAILVNETMARQFWPSGDAIGARIYLGPGEPRQASHWNTVVGIVGDIRQHGPATEVRPTAYGSTRQYSWPRRNFVVRLDGSASVSASDLRAIVRAVDPLVAPGPVAPLSDAVAEQTARHRLTMLGLVFFGIIATVLCGFGLYASVALGAQLRRREYVIRRALGASKGNLGWLVLRQALLLSATGAILGMGLAAATTRMVRALLHGVGALDPIAFGCAAGTMILLALLAGWLPARDAARVDAADALNAD